MAKKVVFGHDGKNLLRRRALAQQYTELEHNAKIFWRRRSQFPRICLAVHWNFTADTDLDYNNQQDNASSTSITLPKVAVGEQDLLCVRAVNQCSRGLPHVPNSTVSYSVDIHHPQPQLYTPGSLWFWKVVPGLDHLHSNIYLRLEYPLSRTVNRHASRVDFAFSNNGIILELHGQPRLWAVVSVKGWKMENRSRSSTICRQHQRRYNSISRRYWEDQACEHSCARDAELALARGWSVWGEVVSWRLWHWLAKAMQTNANQAKWSARQRLRIQNSWVLPRSNRFEPSDR